MKKQNWIKKHPVWSGIIGIFLLFILIGIFSGGDNVSTTNTQPNQNNPESEKPTNTRYITEISTIYLSMMDISESTSGTINALSSGMIDLKDFKKRVDKLWYESYQNSELLKKINPSKDCEKAHHYLREASAGQFLVLDELSEYSEDYKESHISQANSYMESTTININKLGIELEINCK